MSLLNYLPKRLQVTLSEQGVRLVSLNFFGKVAAPAVELPLASSTAATARWQAATDALKTWLAVQPARAYQLNITLADCFVHYQVLPWRAGISRQREWQGYATHRYQEVFGDMSHAWQITLSDNPPGQARLACAIEKNLLIALTTLAPQSVRVLSIQPALIAAYNSARRQCRDAHFGFASLEHERVSLLWMDNGNYVAVRNEAVRESWPQALADLSRRIELGSQIQLGCAGESEDAREGAAKRAAHYANAPLYVSGNVHKSAAPAQLGSHPLRLISMGAKA